MSDFQRLKPLIFIFSINFVMLLVALLFSINRMVNFFDNWFIVALISTSLLSLRFLYENGAYDTINYSFHKIKSIFHFKKEEVIDEYDTTTKKFKNIHDYIEYRKEQKTLYTTYLFTGALLGLILSVVFSLI